MWYKMDVNFLSFVIFSFVIAGIGLIGFALVYIMDLRDNEKISSVLFHLGIACFVIGTGLMIVDINV